MTYLVKCETCNFGLSFEPLSGELTLTDSEQQFLMKNKYVTLAGFFIASTTLAHTALGQTPGQFPTDPCLAQVESTIYFASGAADIDDYCDDRADIRAVIPQAVTLTNFSATKVPSTADTQEVGDLSVPARNNGTIQGHFSLISNAAGCFVQSMTMSYSPSAPAVNHQ